MLKATQSQIIKKLIICLVMNIILIIILYSLPIRDNGVQLCIFKAITGKQCYNCGMTRAFLSVLHFRFSDALNYNKNVIIVFPFTVILFLNFEIKYILKKGSEKDE